MADTTIAPDVLKLAELSLQRGNIKAHMLAEPTDPIEVICNAIMADRAARAAAQPAPDAVVAVKGLEWRHYPDAFPPAWDAQTSMGRYSIAQESVEADAAGEPIDPTDIWVITCDGRTIGSKYDLDAAKALAFTDCERRVMGVLKTARQTTLVLPLEWEAVSGGFVREEAECVLGLYRIAQSRITNTWRWSLNALDGPWSLELPTHDEAKAAAQAHFDAAIRSALAPVPGVGEAVKPSNFLSGDRLLELLSGFSGVEYLAPTDRLDAPETLALVKEALYRRQADRASPPPDRIAGDMDALRADNERLLQAGITGALKNIELTRVIDRAYEIVRQESASLASSVESFWCITLPGSEDRLLAEDAERSVRRLAALAASPATGER